MTCLTFAVCLDMTTSRLPHLGQRKVLQRDGGHVAAAAAEGGAGREAAGDGGRVGRPPGRLPKVGPAAVAVQLAHPVAVHGQHHCPVGGPLQVHAQLADIRLREALHTPSTLRIAAAHQSFLGRWAD